MLNTNKIILSLIIVMIIMTFLMLFKLPKYRIPGYISVIILSIITCMFILKISNNYKFSVIQILFFLAPLVFTVIINTNKHFEKILDNKNNKSTKLQSLQTLNIILTIIQLILLYNSIDNVNTNFLYGSGIASVLNLFLTGLLWREVSFYTTDG